MLNGGFIKWRRSFDQSTTLEAAIEEDPTETSENIFKVFLNFLKKKFAESLAPRPGPAMQTLVVTVGVEELQKEEEEEQQEPNQLIILDGAYFLRRRGRRRPVGPARWPGW